MQTYPRLTPSKWMGFDKAAFIPPALNRAHTNLTSPSTSSAVTSPVSHNALKGPSGFTISRRRSEGSMSGSSGEHKAEEYRSTTTTGVVGPSAVFPKQSGSSQYQIQGSDYSQTPFIELSSPPATYSLLTDDSPARSNHSSTQSRGGVTPRAEISAPIWPLAFTGYENPVGRSAYGMDGLLDKNEMMKLEEDLESALKGKDIPGAKYGGVDTRPRHLDHDSSASTAHGDVAVSSTDQQAQSGYITPLNPESSSNPVTPPIGQKLLAASSLTGCQITSPISPPAHYPSSTSRRNSRSQSQSGQSKSGSSSSSLHTLASSEYHIIPPTWAQPPEKGCEKKGRGRSFRSDGVAPGLEKEGARDDEVLVEEQQEGDCIEIMKGSEGRIAIKSEVGFYNIMCWRPGFSLDDITISAKGHHVVQIVADLWDNDDHAEWNVSLGPDADMQAITAKFNDGQLLLKVARKARPSNPFWSSLLRCSDMGFMEKTNPYDTPIGTMARIGCRNPLPMYRERTRPIEPEH